MSATPRDALGVAFELLRNSGCEPARPVWWAIE